MHGNGELWAKKLFSVGQRADRRIAIFAGVVHLLLIREALTGREISLDKVNDECGAKEAFVSASDRRYCRHNNKRVTGQQDVSLCRRHRRRMSAVNRSVVTYLDENCRE